MPIYNRAIHAAVTVTFVPGTTDPLIATDPTSGLQVAYDVASVARKVGEPVGVYTVVLSESIGAMAMVPHTAVWCETDGKGATVHPTIDADGTVSVLEIRGTYTEGATVGTLADIMFILQIENQWMSA